MLNNNQRRTVEIFIPWVGVIEYECLMVLSTILSNIMVVTVIGGGNWSTWKEH